MNTTGFVRGITKSYKVLYLFLKNKTSYILLKVLYFFDRSYIFLTSLILDVDIGTAAIQCNRTYSFLNKTGTVPTLGLLSMQLQRQSGVHNLIDYFY